MKPAAFDYLQCETEAEAIDCLAQYGEEARILAGGQSLVAMLNMRLVQPQVLVDIGRVETLTALHDTGNAIRTGAAVTQTRLQHHAELMQKTPLLAQALPHIGHFQTRNKGTVCGSLAHADPSSELPLTASVLNATIGLRSARGARDIRARDFFLGLLQTAREPDELVTHATFPHAKEGEGFAFNETAMRHGDFAIIAVAVKADAKGITIGIGGGAEKPEVRAYPLLDGSALDDALNALAWELPLQDDTQAPAAYRRRLVRAIGARTIKEARSCLA
ncbi:MAG: FAD binding domain-containing protein [Hyphomicrobiales bacterium]|nr:FAD binding domain-containing protein [Hyphomicrobiales bacterium]